MKKIKGNGPKMVGIGIMSSLILIFMVKKRYRYSKMYKDRATAEAEELKFKTKRDNPTLVKFDVVASEYFDYMLRQKKNLLCILMKMSIKRI